MFTPRDAILLWKWGIAPSSIGYHVVSRPYGLKAIKSEGSESK